MFTPPKVATLRFTEDGTETQIAIAAATTSLLRSQRSNPQLRIVLAGHGLAAKTIAALISALRKLREVGGAIELRAENQEVRQVIVRHGLERIFEFPRVPSAPAAGWGVRNAIAGLSSRAVAQFRTLIGPSPARFRKDVWMIW